MIWTVLIILATIFVSYANGANDNFKGVATLLGSGITDYRKALIWATITTFAGSLAAFFFATKFIKTFSGKGLVPDALIADPHFLLAVALAASTMVITAALTGIPISTTHSLAGALVGAGLVAIGPPIGWTTLGRSFLMPLFLRARPKALCRVVRDIGSVAVGAPGPLWPLAGKSREGCL